ncbi:hypothetical protein FI667_g8129, partial [Globisporangium splendens]
MLQCNPVTAHASTHTCNLHTHDALLSHTNSQINPQHNPCHNTKTNAYIHARTHTHTHTHTIADRTTNQRRAPPTPSTVTLDKRKNASHLPQDPMQRRRCRTPEGEQKARGTSKESPPNRRSPLDDRERKSERATKWGAGRPWRGSENEKHCATGHARASEQASEGRKEGRKERRAQSKSKQKQKQKQKQKETPRQGIEPGSPA